MSSLNRFPIATLIMIIITFFFIVMYMITSDIFFYNDNSIRTNFDDMANKTITNPLYRGVVLNNSENQKTFFQYGMITCVCMCPVIFLIEIFSGRRDD